MKIVILLGIHGAGKGDQMKLLLDRGFVQDYLSTGQLFFTIHDPASRYFKYEQRVKPYEHLLTEGKYIPDDVTIAIVKEELQADKAKGLKIIGMEGFPRTLQQAQALLVAAAELGDIQFQFIFLDVSDSVAIARLAHRATYDQRRDDTVNQKRLALYHQLTDPMVSFLRTKGLIKDVDDLPPIEEVHRSIVAALT